MHIEESASRPGDELRANLRTLAEVRRDTLRLRSDLVAAKATLRDVQDRLALPTAPTDRTR
ncbi:hypothetical protein [Dactylosporangium salmoneum]|uniref:Uncharacterized protein n=1 Tax=Dactylosporangium salmoneum TaxID=53361 RepID=A0ABN3GW42_9ACTN